LEFDAVSGSDVGHDRFPYDAAPNATVSQVVETEEYVVNALLPLAVFMSHAP